MSVAYVIMVCNVKHSPDYCSGWVYLVAAKVNPGTMCLRSSLLACWDLASIEDKVV